MSQPSDLRVACVRSLDRYFWEAQRTCALLLAVENLTASHQERQAIVEQRLLENAAFQNYSLARTRLLEEIMPR